MNERRPGGCGGKVKEDICEAGEGSQVRPAEWSVERAARAPLTVYRGLLEVVGSDCNNGA